MKKNIRKKIIYFQVFFLLCLFFWGRNLDTEVHLDFIFAPFSKSYWFGSDDLGRDVFSLLLVGGFRTMEVVLIAGSLSFGVGVFLGMLSGYLENTWSLVIKSLVDLLMIIPTFICALIITSIFGINPFTAGLSLGAFGIGNYMNHAEALTKREKKKEYVEAALLLGVPAYRILYRNILPNIISELKVNLGNTASGAILQYASLTFIGLGADFSKPDWGMMLYQYRLYLVSHPLLVLLPSLCIAWISLLLQFLWDTPKEREERWKF
ncbi:ABC transporter permease [Fusobacterium necrophorum]|uniref:ABC transporter permease n=1 Tax=Fusobacterium necrophorum TaxID=859 RepID=UPI000787577D|nr:ABC transporter permease [Fusobacterium necrophorum]KYM44979.1 peptide ABC transporter permease [Fusobacterium necrophorum subsp. funduliforme]